MTARLLLPFPTNSTTQTPRPFNCGNENERFVRSNGASV